MGEGTFTAQNCADHKRGRVKGGSKIPGEAPELQQTRLLLKLDKAAFTMYMQPDPKWNGRPSLDNVYCPNLLQKFSLQAFCRVKPRKAVEADELLVEVISIDPRLVASLPKMKWSDCNERNYIIKDSRRGVSLLLFNKGGPTDPPSFRPKPLL